MVWKWRSFVGMAGTTPERLKGGSSLPPFFVLVILPDPD